MDKYSSLRKKAAEHLEQTPDKLVHFSSFDKNGLLHELRIHHFELEMQNEELLASQHELNEAQARLETSLEKYTRLYEHAPCGYITLDPKRTIVEANLMAGTLLGVTRDRLIGENITTFIDPEDQARAQEHYAQARESRTRQISELKVHNHPFGATYLLLETITEHSGVIPGQFQSILIDITGRKKAKTEKLNIHINQSVISDALVGIISIDDLGIIKTFNHMAERIFGYMADELIGKSIKMLMPDPYRTLYEAHIKNYLRTGQSKFIGLSQEVTAVRKNGEIFFLKLSVSKTHLGGQTYYTGIVQDITEHKFAEMELKSYKNHMGELVNQKTQNLRDANASLVRALHEEEAMNTASPDILFMADAQAGLIKWNKKLEEISGYSFDELIGKECDAFITGNEAECFNKAVQRLVRENKAEMEAQLLTKSGHYIPYHFCIIPNMNANKEVVGFIGSGRDISELKLTEARLQQTQKELMHAEKLYALGQLTGAIAHEFNNPIYGIYNVLEMTKEVPQMTKDQKSLLDLAMKECNRMSNLVRRLQDFYKPSDGVRSWLDIHQTLDDTIHLMKRELSIKKIELNQKYAHNLPKINAIEDQVKQVFINLLQNAEDAISPAMGTITVTTESLDDNNIKIAIRDTGEGIPPENLRLLFKPFFSTKGRRGSGLGLSVCHKIVHSHGGNIEVSSLPGEGSTFTLILPVQGVVDKH